MPSEIKTSIDVALWFADQALNSNEYLQPQKLHRLMYLAQAYYAAAYNGRKLMPAIFVADALGPIEPNVFKVFARGRPNVEPELFFPSHVEEFLRSIWRRFGHYSSQSLTRIAKQSMAYRVAFKKGEGEEISFDSMRLSFTRAEETPAVDQVLKPKMLRTQSGRAVAVKAWVPTARPVRPR